MPAPANKAVLLIGFVPEFGDFSTMPGLNAGRLSRRS